MRILIADDEVLARQRLRALLEDVGGPYRVAGEAENGDAVLARCAAGDVDIVLMDIRMPGLDGMEAARRLAQAESPPAVIFTTAYEEHALEAFEKSAVDYLLKPIRLERLRQALAKAQAPTRPQRWALKDAGVMGESARRQVCASYRGGMRAVPIAEVIFFLADQKYVTVRHLGGELLLEESLRSLEQEFGDLFVRIHRNALVAKSFLEGMEHCPDGRRRVRLRGAHERLEISRRHLGEVRRWLRAGA